MVSCAKLTSPAALRQPLERLYRDFDYGARLGRDAIQYPLRYADPADREIVALLTACLAYGRVDLFGRALEGALAVMGPSPVTFVREFDPARDATAFAGFIYRFNRPRDLVAFCVAARDLLARHGTLEKCFLAGDADPRGPIGPPLERFARAFLEADLHEVFSRGRRVARAPADPRGHPRREHEPGHRPHAPALAELEDGRGDHRAAGRARSRRSRQVRLRALSHAHGRRLSGPPGRRRLPAVRPARRLPSLEAGRSPSEASMTEVTGVLLGALLVVLAVLAWTLFGTRRELAEMRSQPPSSDPAVGLLKQELESVRREGREDQERLRREVGTLTGEVTRQLEQGMQLIQAGQTSMGARLDAATKVVGDVQGSLGTLQEATRRVAEIGREIQGLEQVLKSPKVRGGLGETLLERLLDEMLPREHWMTQHAFRSGEKVDAAIKIGERIVPVDAKFPLENFRRMLGETDDAQRRQHRKAFARDVKLRVDEIAKKYILPDEGTYDFALMNVPAENVYYEIAIRPEDADEEPIAAYALSRRVVPVSPNSIFAYLQVIVLGLRGLRIEANARRIQEDLARLGGDVAKLRGPLATLGRHLGNAQKQYEDAQRELDRLEMKLDEIGRKGAETELGAAPAEPPTLPGVV